MSLHPRHRRQGVAEMGLLPQLPSLPTSPCQALLPPAAHTDARTGTGCTFGVHRFFGSSSRGTAGQTIWHFLPGYLTRDALTVLANSRSTERYLVSAGPCAITCSNMVFLPAA